MTRVTEPPLDASTSLNGHAHTPQFVCGYVLLDGDPGWGGHVDPFDGKEFMEEYVGFEDCYVGAGAFVGAVTEGEAGAGAAVGHGPAWAEVEWVVADHG